MTNEFPLSVYALGQPTIIARRIYPSHCAIYLMQNILITVHKRQHRNRLVYMDGYMTYLKLNFGLPLRADLLASDVRVLVDDGECVLLL